MATLLAKSATTTRPGRTLVEHTCDVVEAFKALFGTPACPTRLAARWAALFDLDDVEPFIRNGVIAAWTHDWGKANDGFQATLNGTGRQLLRHEHLSAMLLHLPEVRAWLRRCAGIDEDVVLAAVAGHHLKCSHEELGASHGEPDSVLHVMWDHDDLAHLLRLMATDVGLTVPAQWGVKSSWSFQPQLGDFDAKPHLKDLKRRLGDVDDEFVDDEPRRRLAWAVRAGLIAADSAGSGLVREGHQVAEWVRAAFEQEPPMNGTAVWSKVVEPRVMELTTRGRWRGWTDFQAACATLPDRALVLAPCGSGKTLAAWRWIAARLDARPASRVIFLYPTRGTATEGFRDYVSWAPEADAALVHGTATFDLEGMFDNPADPRDGRSYESRDRLFALNQWPKRIFSATVDQFLAFLQYGYGPVCLLPLLADSVVVVDEVHSFDRRMFGALTDFLTTFRDVPVLCMTATLAEDRRRKLAGCGMHVYPREMPADLRACAEHKRYAVRTTTEAGARDHVGAALRDGKRVLWVVNNVRRAQALARSFAPDAEEDGPPKSPQGAPVFCYHSRFKLEDRRRQHEAVVSAFKQGGPAGAVLAVTTQVCEMSLDLDANVVVTEEAPVTALIQRMGRCCRAWPVAAGRTGEVWVYKPEDGKPYKPEQLAGVREFMDRVAGLETASQADLEAALLASPQPPESPAPECRFIGSGPWAMAGEESFRDADEFTRQAVLPEDIEEFVKLRRNPNHSWKADGLVLPVPVYLAKDKDERLPAYLHLAQGGHYSRTLGYLDEPRPHWIV